MADLNFADNPFAVLTAIVAPAILTNACSVLSLGTSNRIARVVDRTRVVYRELESLPHDSGHYRELVVQLSLLEERAQYLFRSLRLFYISLGCFVASALISIVGSAMAFYHFTLGFRVLATLGLITGLLGVCSLVAGSALMVAEVRAAISQITHEAQRARNSLVRPPTV